jgi:hypothetical protein
MKRPLLVLILCLFAGAVAVWLLRQPQMAGTQQAAPRIEEHPPAADAHGTVAATAIEPEPENPSAPGAAGGAEESRPRFKRAYMVSLDKGALALVDSQDIEGDFAPSRREPEVWSGMLRCRLMSGDNVVLAEELLPAPDYVCSVLDPKSGTDKPVSYAVERPVVFQLRLPRVKGAARLEIYRIIQPGDPVLEGLLGTIPLPRS